MLNLADFSFIFSVLRIDNKCNKVATSLSQAGSFTRLIGFLIISKLIITNRPNKLNFEAENTSEFKSVNF